VLVQQVISITVIIVPSSPLPNQKKNENCDYDDCNCQSIGPEIDCMKIGNRNRIECATVDSANAKFRVKKLSAFFQLAVQMAVLVFFFLYVRVASFLDTTLGDAGVLGAKIFLRIHSRSIIIS
jgi:hypothetical protein